MFSFFKSNWKHTYWINNSGTFENQIKLHHSWDSILEVRIYLWTYDQVLQNENNKLMLIWTG